MTPGTIRHPTGIAPGKAVASDMRQLGPHGVRLRRCRGRNNRLRSR